MCKTYSILSEYNSSTQLSLSIIFCMQILMSVLPANLHVPAASTNPEVTLVHLP